MIALLPWCSVAIGLAAAVVLSSNHGLDTAACYPRRLKTAYKGGEHCGAYAGWRLDHHMDGRAVRVA